MLTEIICEKFNEKNQKIIFHTGLNVVLGDDIGTNSIGKSTFLMIIDFAFGGDDYIEKCEDVFRQVGFHQIKFAFTFKDSIYRFVRNTKNPNFVSKCDENYNIQGEISIEELREFLKTQYEIIDDDLSFRDTVSGYYRIYQRGNYNEHRPLQFFEGESAEKSIIRLVKLYNLYGSIRGYENLVKENTDILKAYRNSLNRGFLPKITKKQYENDKKEISKTEEEIDAIAADLDSDTSDIENLKAKEVRELKSMLSVVHSKLTKYEHKRASLQYELSENNSPTISSSDFFESLKSFFPNANIQKLSDIDYFHKGLFRILNKEVKYEIDRLDVLIDECKTEMSNLSQQLDSYQNEKHLSKVVLKKIENIVEHKTHLVAETESYDKLKAYELAKKQSEKRLEKELGVILLQLQTKINSELVIINKNVYVDEHQSPILSLLRRNYNYSSPDDNGTGTNYKNLIILDICLLKQTVLPALIHDSIVFKNIGDEPLEKLFVQYTNFDKQIFIAFDRLSTYSEKVQKLLNDNCILRLGDNKEALFGFTWSVKNHE